MTAMEFNTAARRVEMEKAEAEYIPFTLDGVEYEALNPDENQIALLMAAFGGYSEMPEQMGTIINFFFSLLGDEDQRALKRRLLDPTDPFSITDVSEITLSLVESVTGRPTQRPTASTPSRRSGGPKSTAGARSTASTRSRSPRTASAT